ncbi:MAG: leucyl aminopeptidase family protein [Cytophagaceae bacterium]
MIKLHKSNKLKHRIATAVLLDKKNDIKSFLTIKETIEKATEKVKDQSITYLVENSQDFFFVKTPEKTAKSTLIEKYRRLGSDLFDILQKEKNKELQITASDKDIIIAFAEGLALSAYTFNKYKSVPAKINISEVHLLCKDLSKEDINELSILVESVFLARDLVNEPLNHLTAEQLADEIKICGKNAGFKVEVLNKSKIQSLKMGGLLGVNAGSPNPPTFSILEYKPKKHQNTSPYILIGKGVVYDTGGLSLKPSESMEAMKCDMAGAAAVIGAINAIAKNQLPLHIIGLIPATENRPDGNAMVPGDVIRIFGGKTVEVLNTDAEGRLILADALAFASKYKPELVINLATLTGAAARAIGSQGVVFMGNASAKVKNKLSESGYDVHERLVEFPLWEEYDKMIDSDIADIKNIGGSEAGAITAGKFLEHFVDYEWIHIDIAGMAFLPFRDGYRSKNGSGIGVRLLYHYFKKKVVK